jgi:hypothetical protein
MNAGRGKGARAKQCNSTTKIKAGVLGAKHGDGTYIDALGRDDSLRLGGFKFSYIGFGTQKTQVAGLGLG